MYENKYLNTHQKDQGIVFLLNTKKKDDKCNNLAGEVPAWNAGC